MTDYLEIDICVETAAQNDMLIAQLAEAGFEGFEETPKLLKAFIPENGFNEEAVKMLMTPQNLTYTVSLLRQTNWNAIWEAGFEPVAVEGFCTIRAAFHAAGSTTTHELVITPKMSFGTGHHATTYMMVAAMEAIDFQGRSVLDFGTGTGVLAILAEKLGALTIDAIDNDDWSIENAKENLEMNGCKKVNLRHADHLLGSGSYDVMLANLNRHVIMAQLPDMKAHAVPGGIILLSGLLVDDFEDVLQKASALELMLVDKKERNSWLCLQLSNGVMSKE